MHWYSVWSESGICLPFSSSLHEGAYDRWELEESWSDAGTQNTGQALPLCHWNTHQHHTEITFPLLWNDEQKHGSVCMCTCTYMHVSIYIYACVCMHLHALVCVSVCVHVHSCARMCMNVDALIHVCVCVCVCVCICVCLSVCAHVHECVWACMHLCKKGHG